MKSNQARRISSASNIIQFPSISREPLKVSKVHPKTYVASGDSLNGVGVFNEDILICRAVKSLKDANGKVCIVLIDGDYLAKIVNVNLNGTITLKSASPNFPDYTIEINRVEIVGVVHRLQRDL